MAYTDKRVSIVNKAGNIYISPRYGVAAEKSKRIPLPPITPLTHWARHLDLCDHCFVAFGKREQLCELGAELYIARMMWETFNELDVINRIENRADLLRELRKRRGNSARVQRTNIALYYREVESGDRNEQMIRICSDAVASTNTRITNIGKLIAALKSIS